jgi:A/G-specific adenine glycosylase
MDILSLKAWFQKEKRDLPWRRDPTPYKVWISEVMLQQTQVAVVIPYFTRWIERFPSIASLAEAESEEVLKAWEGLGFYARARSLHEAARILLKEHGGVLPSCPEELAKIKGIGPYTCGAILSFAFHQKAAAVDGNVARVLSRYFLIEEVITKSGVQKQIRALTLEILPSVEPWVIMEALIELGATLCQKEPKCALCPLQNSCKGFLTGKMAHLPKLGTKMQTIALFRKVAVIVCGVEILLKRENEKKVMEGLYEFPYFEETGPLREIVEKNWGFEVEEQSELFSVKHSFTCYRVTLHASLFKVKTKKALPPYEWKRLEDVPRLAFSSGHKRLLSQIEDRVTS